MEALLSRGKAQLERFSMRFMIPFNFLEYSKRMHLLIASAPVLRGSQLKRNRMGDSVEQAPFPDEVGGRAIKVSITHTSHPVPVLDLCNHILTEIR